MRALLASLLAMSCASAPASPGQSPTATSEPGPETAPPLSSASPAERTGEAPARPGEAARLPCEEPCNGELTPSLSEALQAQARSTRACYERELQEDATAQGRVAVSLRVGRDGQVCSVALGASELGSRVEFARCVEERLKASPLPAPGGGCLDAVVPLNFVPAPAPSGSASAPPPPPR